VSAGAGGLFSALDDRVVGGELWSTGAAEEHLLSWTGKAWRRRRASRKRPLQQPAGSRRGAYGIVPVPSLAVRYSSAACEIGTAGYVRSSLEGLH